MREVVGHYFDTLRRGGRVDPAERALHIFAVEPFPEVTLPPFPMLPRTVEYVNIMSNRMRRWLSTELDDGFYLRESKPRRVRNERLFCLARHFRVFPQLTLSRLTMHIRVMQDLPKRNRPGPDVRDLEDGNIHHFTAKRELHFDTGQWSDSDESACPYQSDPEDGEGFQLREGDLRDDELRSAAYADEEDAAVVEEDVDFPIHGHMEYDENDEVLLRDATYYHEEDRRHLAGISHLEVVLVSDRGSSPAERARFYHFACRFPDLTKVTLRIHCDEFSEITAARIRAWFLFALILSRPFRNHYDATNGPRVTEVVVEFELNGQTDGIREPTPERLVFLHLLRDGVWQRNRESYVEARPDEQAGRNPPRWANSNPQRAETLEEPVEQLWFETIYDSGSELSGASGSTDFAP